MKPPLYRRFRPLSGLNGANGLLALLGVLALAASSTLAQTYTGSTVVNASLAGPLQGYVGFYDTAVFNADIADSVIGSSGVQSFHDQSKLNALVSNAFGGGAYLSFDGTAVLNAEVASSVGAGTRQFSGSSVYNLDAAGVSNGGYTYLNGSSTYNANVAGAGAGDHIWISSGSGARIEVNATNALGDATIYFQGGGGTYLDLNGNSTTVGIITSEAGVGVIQNGSATAATLTVNYSGTNTYSFASGAVYSGVIQDGAGSGSLALVKEGTSTWKLSGANTYTGGTSINAGTLALGSGGSLAAGGAVSVASGATFDISGAGANQTIGDLSGSGTVNLGANSLTTGTANDTAFSGNLVGSGGLVKRGSGTLVLGGINPFTGGTTILGGTIEIQRAQSLGAGTSVTFGGSGATLRIDGDFTLNQTITLSTTGTIDTGAHAVSLIGTIQGSGALAKVGTGTLESSGNNTYSGPTTVSGGTLQIDGSLSSSAVTVNGGTLRGSGTISRDIVVDAGGGIAAGSASAVGTLHVGNLTLNSGSTTTLRVNSASSYDKIVSTGTITLGGTLNLTLGAGLLNGDALTLIQGGTVSGSFSTTSVTSNLNNALSFSLSSSATSVGVTITATATQQSFVPFAVGGNESAVARNLDKVANDPRAADLIRSLNGLSGATLPAALQQLSPVQQTLTAGTSLSVSRMAVGTLQNRMDNIRAGSTGLSIDQVNLIDSDLPASALLAGTDLSVGQGVKILAPDPKNKWGFFLATNGNFGDVDGQTTQSNYHGVGLTAGADYRLDRAFTVGFAAGYDWSKTDFDNSGSNSEANSVRFGPYATWKDQTGDWLDMNVGGAHHWYDSNREGFGGTAVSSTTGLEFDSGMKYGHDFKLKDWTLTPTFGLDYMRLMIDGYTESGSLAPLAIQDQTVDSFRTNLGGTVGYTFTSKGVRWTPYLSLGWAHELLDASSAVNARFASGAGDVFATQGDSLGHDSATFGTGIRGAFTDSLSAALSYSGEANGTYQNHAFEASLRVAF